MSIVIRVVEHTGSNSNSATINNRLLPRLFFLSFSLFFFLAVYSQSHAAPTNPVISIIIDDLGYKIKDDLRVLGLPAPIVCAVMPHGPHSKQLAVLANRAGKEVILHLPMQAMHEPKNEYLGPGALKLHMSKNEFISTLRNDLNAIPHTIGLNNHMGSLLTQHPGHMQWLMDELKQRGHIYIDSVTSDHSVAAMIADETDVPYLTRDVFLDNKQSKSYIQGQVQQLIKRARKNGSAIAIGHPHPETIKALGKLIVELNKSNIKIIPIKQMLKLRQQGKISWQKSSSHSHRVVKN